MSGGKIEVQGGGTTAIVLAKINSTITLNSVNTLSSHDDTIGLYVQTGGHIKVSDQSQIRVAGANSSALNITNGGDISIDSSVVEAKEQGSVGLSVRNDDGTLGYVLYQF